MRVLQVIEPMPERYARLAKMCKRRLRVRKDFLPARPLKFGFTLTLSLVALSTLLLAGWAAIYAARRVGNADPRLG